MQHPPPDILALEHCPENFETIGLQQGSSRRTLERILTHIDKDLHDIGFLLVPVLTFKPDDSVESHLKQVANKNTHVSRNIKTHEIEGINNVDNPLTLSSDLSLCKLVMHIKAQDGERFSVAIARN